RRHTISTRDWSSDVCSSDLDGLFEDRAVAYGPTGHISRVGGSTVRSRLTRFPPEPPSTRRRTIRVRLRATPDIRGTADAVRGRRSEERRVGKDGGARGGAVT